jgi:hypothetical protein
VDEARGERERKERGTEFDTCAIVAKKNGGRGNEAMGHAEVKV